MDVTRPSEWLKLLAAFFRHDKTREGIGVLAMALAVLVAASLATYNPRDPSFFNYASPTALDQEIHNAVGRVGAELAADLLGILGLSALLVPPAFFLWGWTWVGGRAFGHPIRKGFGLILLTLSLSLLASMLQHAGILPGGLVDRPGGFLGDELFRLLFFSLGKFGMGILSVACLVLAATCFSPKPLTAFLGWPAAGLGKISSRLSAASAARRARRIAAASAKARATQESAARVPVGVPEPSVGARVAVVGLTPSPAEVGTPPAAPAAPTASRKEAKGAKESVGQQPLPFAAGKQGYNKPSLKLLDTPSAERSGTSQEEMVQNSQILEKKLQEFDVEGRVTAVNPGPVITSYEIEPGPGIKINRIVALADDLALGLRALSVRVVAPIPGKAAVGVEIPNRHRATVHLREVLATKEFGDEALQLPLAMGKDVSGAATVAELAQMPHLLIAGETGSGKSVCINSLILSILFRAEPQDVRLLLIDPKRVELSMYNGVPHLADKVVSDPKEAAKRLQRVVKHMEERYRLFAQVGARNLQSYNRRMELEPPPEDDLTQGSYRGRLPMLVVIIDELADLILTAQNEVENAIMRLAQMARAVGIHLIVATQRPSVDVITGVIKANFPARISFRVASKVDSRTILDMNGAETLLGKGDMLFIPPGSSKPIRIHGCNVTEVEIRRVVDFLATQIKPGEFVWSLLPPEPDEATTEGEGDDEMYRQAVDLVVQTQQASISMIQRRLRVGFNRAARMIERMEREGIVSPMDGTRPREVLISRAES